MQNATQMLYLQSLLSPYLSLDLRFNQSHIRFSSSSFYSIDFPLEKSVVVAAGVRGNHCNTAFFSNRFCASGQFLFTFCIVKDVWLSISFLTINGLVKFSVAIDLYFCHVRFKINSSIFHNQTFTISCR